MKFEQQYINATNAINKIKQDLKNAIKDIEENPKAIPISDNPRCFIISSKDVINTSMSPYFHSFKFHNETLIKIIEQASNPIERIKQIIDTGKFYPFKTENQVYLNRLNPDYIILLKKILNIN